MSFIYVVYISSLIRYFPGCMLTRFLLFLISISKLKQIKRLIYILWSVTTLLSPSIIAPQSCTETLTYSDTFIFLHASFIAFITNNTFLSLQWQPATTKLYISLSNAIPIIILLVDSEEFNILVIYFIIISLFKKN